LPNGASTKNAGFACYGSISEILDDLDSHSEEEVVKLVQKRIRGLQLLRKNLGDEILNYHEYGGYELFTKENAALFETCISKISKINKLLQPIFGSDVFSVCKNSFGFKNIQEKLIYSKFEGQLDTGKMMTALLQKVQGSGVKVLNNTRVLDFSDTSSSVAVQTEHFSFKTGKLLVATNGFASQLGFSAVKPARAQVLITQPLKELPFKGTFHLEKGYYYFRNVGNRILLGGGRNLDFHTEETTRLDLTSLVQNKLEELLKTTILPGADFTVERRWSGIMGVGSQKKPLVKQVSENVFCGVRLGGMGVAIGSHVGCELAGLVK
jgi:gamma-glutamylputrescine oxidase